MAAFRYEALDGRGRKKHGVLSADNQRIARQELAAAGFTLLKLETMAANDGGSHTTRRKIGRLRRMEVVLITRQLATLVHATTPVEEALGAVAAQMDKPRVSGILLAIRARLMEGWRLSDALGEHDASFSALYRSVVASAEASGNLDAALLRLAEMLEKSRAIAIKALSAIVYPAILFLVAVGVVSGLLIFVVPKIVAQFDTFGAQLPLVTRLVIGASAFLHHFGGALLVIFLLLGVAYWRALKIAAIRLLIDRFYLRLPLMGRLLQNLETARFSRTLSTLFASGTPLLDSLHGARETVLNTHMKRRLAETIDAVQEGSSLSVGLRRAAVFAPMMAYMVAAGERAGALPTMLDTTAGQVEEEYDITVTLLLRLLEPVIIVGMGVIILIIVLAILVPILQLNSLAGL